MTDSEQQKQEFFSLLARYNELGRLLQDDLDFDDARAVAGQRLVLKEMHDTQLKIKKIMDDRRPSF